MKKNLLKVSTFLIIFMLLFVSVSFSQNTHVSMDHVDGLYMGDVRPDVPLKFHIRWANFSGSKLCITSYYRVFLSNNGELSGGTFQPIVLDTIPELAFGSKFDLVQSIQYRSADGVGSDTAGYDGSVITGAGYPNGWDTVAVTISTAVSSMYAGDSLCIDSCSFLLHPWKWALGIQDIPTWAGPYCYEILPSCCVGMKGNFSNDDADMVDISDLDNMIGFIFRMEPGPICFTEADFNGDGFVDISDLVWLVDFMFTSGPQPPDCN